MTAAQLSSVVVNELTHLIHSQKFLEESRTKPQFFTRMRCLSFVDYILYLLSKANRSLQIGLNQFLQNRVPCSKQAFSKGRRHIRNEAFLKLAELVRDRFYADSGFHTWSGYRLLAVDGTKLNMPYSANLMKDFGAQASSGDQVQCMLSAIYDVLNHVILSVQAEGCLSSERKVFAQQLLQSTCFRKAKDVFILDRGYPSAKLFDTLAELGHLYLIRCDSQFLDSSLLHGDDCIIEHRFGRSEQIRKYRIVTIRLSNGFTERLITNLLDSSITLEDFAQLYHARWEVEQCFRTLKSSIELENLSGLDKETFLQDLYANLTVVNLGGVFNFAASEKIHREQHHRKYSFEQNQRVLIISLKDVICNMLIPMDFDTLKTKVHTFLRNVSRSLVDIRPQRSYPRKKKHLSQRFATNQRH